MYPQDMDPNELRRLLAMSGASELANPDEQQNALVQMLTPMPRPNYDIAPMQANSMRFESGPDAGKVVNLDFVGRQGGGQQQATAQPQANRVVGYGNGQMTDLGVSARPVDPDFSRPQADIPGLGKGYYSKDGRSAFIKNRDGSTTEVVLGYDAEGSDQMNRRALAREKGRAEIDQTLASTEHTRASTQALNAKPVAAAPAGYRWKGDGGLEAIPGGPADAKSQQYTESQGKAMSFGQRAADAHEILNYVGENGKVQPSLLKRAAEGVPLIGGALGMAANATQSGPQMQVEQAQRNFVNAVLRRESGASISPSEFDSAIKQYFPQPGEPPQVVAQKAANRAMTIQGLAEEAGPGRAKVTGAGEKARARFEAMKAIKAGAPRDQVLQRLQQSGIDTSGI